MGSRIYMTHLELAYSGQMRVQARDGGTKTLLFSLAAEMKRCLGERYWLRPTLEFQMLIKIWRRSFTFF